MIQRTDYERGCTMLLAAAPLACVFMAVAWFVASLIRSLWQ